MLAGYCSWFRVLRGLGGKDVEGWSGGVEWRGGVEGRVEFWWWWGGELAAVGYALGKANFENWSELTCVVGEDMR